MALTIDEIIAGINELAGDDKDKAKDVATAIRERAKPVGQHLINVGSALKKDEVKREIEALKASVETLTTERDEAVAALETANSTKPDIAKIEADWKAKHEKKVGELKEQIKAKDESFRGAIRKGSLAKLVNRLSTKYGIDPEYAQEVLTLKYGASVDVRDDGSTAYKNAEGLEYDGATEDDKIDAFAADIRKGVNPRYVLTNADSGAGVRGSQGGSSYDAAKVGAEMGKQEKAQAADNKLAFT